MSTTLARGPARLSPDTVCGEVLVEEAVTGLKAPRTRTMIYQVHLEGSLTCEDALVVEGSRIRRLTVHDQNAARFDFYLACRAREALQEGTVGRAVDRLAAPLGLRQGGRWREAMSTAVAGDWWDQGVVENGRVSSKVAQFLRSEAQAVHQQLKPLWRRRANGSRVLLLDTPLGEGVSLYDLVAGSPSPQELAFGALPDDDRLTAILNALHPVERRVALAWAHPTVGTWTEAALAVSTTDPVALGERVRRKLKRLGARHTNRAAAGARTTGGAR